MIVVVLSVNRVLPARCCQSGLLLGPPGERDYASNRVLQQRHGNELGHNALVRL